MPYSNACNQHIMDLLHRIILDMAKIMLEVSDNPNRLTTVSTAEVFWALSQSSSASGLLFAGKPSLLTSVRKRGREKQFTNSLNSYLWLWQVTSRNCIFRQPFPLIWLNLVSCILSFYCLFLWLVYFKIFFCFVKSHQKEKYWNFPNSEAYPVDYFSLERK